MYFTFTKTLLNKRSDTLIDVRILQYLIIYTSNFEHFNILKIIAYVIRGSMTAVRLLNTGTLIQFGQNSGRILARFGLTKSWFDRKYLNFVVIAIIC